MWSGKGVGTIGTWDVITGRQPPPGVQAVLDEKERRQTAEQNIADSAETLKVLADLLEQERQARVEAQKQADAEAKRANSLAKWSLGISILSAVFTIIGVVVDLCVTFHGV